MNERFIQNIDLISLQLVLKSLINLTCVANISLKKAIFNSNFLASSVILVFFVGIRTFWCVFLNNIFKNKNIRT